MVPAESPGASAPKSAASASENSPLEIPFRYSHGNNASMLRLRRRYRGTMFELNRTCPLRSCTRGAFTATWPKPVWMVRSGRWPLRTIRARPTASCSP